MTTTTQQAVQKRLAEIRVQSAIAEFGHECKRIVRTDIPALLDLISALLGEREANVGICCQATRSEFEEFQQAQEAADTALRRFAGEEGS